MSNRVRCVFVALTVASIFLLTVSTGGCTSNGNRGATTTTGGTTSSTEGTPGTGRTAGMAGTGATGGGAGSARSGGTASTGGPFGVGGVAGAAGRAGSGATVGIGGAGATAGTSATGGSVGQSGTDAAAGAPGIAGVVSFNGDWDRDPAQGGWADIQVVDPAKLHKDPNTPTWHNRGAARVQVDSGDDPLSLGEGTERAEVLAMQDSAGKQIPEGEGSGTQYYAISYKFPADWAGTEIAGDGTSWSIVFQLHGPDKLGYSPAFALNAAKTTNAGLQKYSVATNGGDRQTGCCGPSYDFSDGGLISLGQWTDFIIMMSFASTPTGHITIWRRDEGQAGFAQVVDVGNVATLQYNSQIDSTGGAHYWKQGLYRGGVNRTDVLWMGPTVRATSFEAAEMAAFGTASGKP